MYFEYEVIIDGVKELSAVINSEAELLESLKSDLQYLRSRFGLENSDRPTKVNLNMEIRNDRANLR